MAISRPIAGHGIGSFPYVYPAFARFDNGYFVNHAHNDWLEAFADGGGGFGPTNLNGGTNPIYFDTLGLDWRVGFRYRF